MTPAALLQQHGYRTAAVGKWHLGWDWPIPKEKMALFRGMSAKDELKPTDIQKAAWQEVFSKPIPGGPTTRGFGSYFGTDVPNWPPFCFIEKDRIVGIPTAFLPLTSPHTPLAVNAAWKGKSGLNRYADFVMETDAIVGRVLEALDKSGAAANTIVLFSSDNGCAPYIGAAELETLGHYPSGPLRGYKSDIWEGGHRVPFVVRWPEVVKAGSISGHLAHHADVTATVAAILGACLPHVPK